MEISDSFEFRHWKEAFDRYYELRKQDLQHLRMVISTHWATSGYWVETDNRPVSEGDYAYVGEEVDKLYARVKEEIEQAAIEKRSVCFTL
jgi:hypothetical protein